MVPFFDQGCCVGGTRKGGLPQLKTHPWLPPSATATWSICSAMAKPTSAMASATTKCTCPPQRASGLTTECVFAFVPSSARTPGTPWMQRSVGFQAVVPAASLYSIGVCCLVYMFSVCCQCVLLVYASRCMCLVYAPSLYGASVW